MSSQNVSRDILDALNGLFEEKFDTFCYLLTNSGEPPIRACEVQNKSRIQITQLLVSRWTEARVVHKTIEILRDIGCNNEAEKLAAKAGAQAQPQQEPSGASPPAQASSEPSSSRDNPSRTPQRDAKTLLSSVRTSFVKNVPDAVLDQLLDLLLDERVLTKEEMDTAKAKLRADKARLMVDSVIMKGSGSAQILIDGYCEIEPKSELCAQLRN